MIASGLSRRVDAARSRLDEHVREIVGWHFDPETGCPFWLDHASKLDFDPREKIRCYDDLKCLGHFEDEWLRGGPVRRWLPRGLKDRPAFIFETGGSTGVPKSRLNLEDFQRDYEIFGDNLPEAGFPRGADWLMLGPTGPRRLRLAIEHLAQYRGGICFFVDLDGAEAVEKETGQGTTAEQRGRQLVPAYQSDFGEHGAVHRFAAAVEALNRPTQAVNNRLVLAPMAGE